MPLFHHKHPFEATDIPSLAGKVALVTGATSGIGTQTALQLALHGARVHLATRSESKTLSLIAQLEKEHPEVKDWLFWLKTDLGSVKACQAAAKEFMSKEPRLDIMVNNGADAAYKFALNDEGVAASFAVNHLGHFALTTSLLPLLAKTAALPGSDVRIVTVSSMMHTGAPHHLTFSGLESFKDSCVEKGKEDTLVAAAARYDQCLPLCQSKLANLLFVKALQKEFDAQGIPALSVAVHPGNVATPGAKSWLGPISFIADLLSLSIPQGALTSLFCATSPLLAPNGEKRAEYKGAYTVPFGDIKKPSEMAEDQELAKRLWATSELAVKEIDEKGRI